VLSQLFLTIFLIDLKLVGVSLDLIYFTALSNCHIDGTIGAKADLLALAQITYIKSRTARVFWESGYKTVGSIAAADAKDLLPILLLVSNMSQM